MSPQNELYSIPYKKSRKPLTIIINNGIILLYGKPNKQRGDELNYDYSKLKGLIREKCGTHAKYAELLGVSTTTLAQRLGNYQPFTQKEIEITKEKFNLTTEELVAVFFTKTIRKTEQSETF